MEPQNPDVRKGRRELSTSKRAAQNRAAQVSLVHEFLSKIRVTDLVPFVSGAQ